MKSSPPLGFIILHAFWLLQTGLQAATAANVTITLAASISTSPPSDNRSITGASAKRGLEMFVDWANNEHEPILLQNGSAVRFALRLLEDNGAQNQMLQNYMQLASEPNTLLIGPVASDFSSLAASNVTEPGNRLLLACVTLALLLLSSPSNVLYFFAFFRWNAAAGTHRLLSRSGFGVFRLFLSEVAPNKMGPTMPRALAFPQYSLAFAFNLQFVFNNLPPFLWKYLHGTPNEPQLFW